MRRGPPRRRRHAGHRGADAREPLPRARSGSRGRPRHQQDRSSGGRPGTRGGGDLGVARCGSRLDDPDVGEGRGGGRCGSRRHRRARPGSGRRPRGTAAGADLRLAVRPLSRSDAHAARRGWRTARGHAHRVRTPRRRLRRRRGRLHAPRVRARRRPPLRGGRVSHGPDQERGPYPRRGYGAGRGRPGRGGPPRLPGSETNGLRRPLSDGLGPVRGAPRGARKAPVERRQPQLRAGDIGRARLRVPVRFSGAPPPGGRAGETRPGVRRRPHHDAAQRGIPGDAHERRRDPA